MRLEALVLLAPFSSSSLSMRMGALEDTEGGGPEKICTLLRSPRPYQGGGTRMGPGGGGLPVSSRAPSLIEEGARRTRRGPGGGGPPPSISSRALSLIDEDEDEKGASRTRAPSLMEEDRTRRGPGGCRGYDPPAPLRRRMRRGTGGRGPPLSSRGQDKEVEEGARRRRTPASSWRGP